MVYRALRKLLCLIDAERVHHPRVLGAGAARSRSWSGEDDFCVKFC